MTPIVFVLSTILLQMCCVNGSKNVNSDEKVIIKSPGRMSRVSWHLHDNSYKPLEGQLFDNVAKKAMYTKRKYNVKVERLGRYKVSTTTTQNTLDENDEPALSFEIPNDLDETRKKSKIGPKVALNTGVSRKKIKKIDYKKVNNSNSDEKPKYFKERFDIEQKIDVNNKQLAVSVGKGIPDLNKQNSLSKTIKADYKNQGDGNGGRKLSLNKDLRERSDRILAISDENLFNQNSAHNSKRQGSPKLVHKEDDRTVADALAKRIRVVCFVLTHPGNHNFTLQPIAETWGEKCSKLLFFSTEHEDLAGTIKLNVPAGRQYLWEKVKAAFTYVFVKHRNDGDWFLMTDDDTFIIMENLRYMLSKYSSKEPLYFGCRFKPTGGAPEGLTSGGAGVVVSRSALSRLAGAIRNNLCSTTAVEDELDDVILGICLARIGVRAMDSRDSLQRSRFLPFMPQDHLTMEKDKTFWYWNYIYYPAQVGMACCSDYAVSFHYVAPEDMYALNYLIYHLRPFGVKFGQGTMPLILRRNKIENFKHKNPDHEHPEHKNHENEHPKHTHSNHDNEKHDYDIETAATSTYLYTSAIDEDGDENIDDRKQGEETTVIEQDENVIEEEYTTVASKGRKHSASCKGHDHSSN